MGLFDALSDINILGFGGGKSSSSSQQRVFEPQADFLSQQYYPYITNLANRYSSNPRSLIEPFNPTQRFGQNLGIQNALGLQGYAQNAQNALGQTLDPMSSFNEPLFRNAFQAAVNPFIRNFQQNIIPSINSQAVGVGQRGGSRQGIAEGNAALGLIDKIGDMGSVYAQHAFNQGINQRLSGLGMASQIGQLGLIPSDYINQIGQMQQSQGQMMRQAPIAFGNQLMQLSGSPTVLGSSQSSGVNMRGASQGFEDVFGGMGGFFGGG